MCSGTGLGLSIVQQIVALMGGRLAFDSEPDRGTTVTVWLPVQAGPSGRENAAASA
jgi:signal transduction histidine kinase